MSFDYDLVLLALDDLAFFAHPRMRCAARAQSVAPPAPATEQAPSCPVALITAPGRSHPATPQINCKGEPRS
jgi:hypothetical protein